MQYKEWFVVETRIVCNTKNGFVVETRIVCNTKNGFVVETRIVCNTKNGLLWKQGLYAIQRMVCCGNKGTNK